MSIFILKVIAAFTMFLDHTGVVYNIDAFRVIGRIAFPIYAFLNSEGCKHTSNIKKYIIRLVIFALISEIPFDMLLNANITTKTLVFWDPKKQNVFFTLFLGSLIIMIYNHLLNTLKKTNNILKFIYIILFIATFLLILFLSEYMRLDYGFLGIILIFLCFISKKSITALLIFSIIKYNAFINLNLNSFETHLFIGSLIPAFLIYFYNGKKGYNIKWFFYLFYPLHMIFLSLSVFILK